MVWMVVVQWWRLTGAAPLVTSGKCAANWGELFGGKVWRHGHGRPPTDAIRTAHTLHCRS